MRLPPASMVPGRLAVRAPALAGSVVGHLLIGALVLLVVVPPTPPPAEPVPVQMVFAPLPDAAPPTLPPVPAPAAEAPSLGPPPTPEPPPQAETLPAPAPPVQAEPLPPISPPAAPDIPVPEPLPLKPPMPAPPPPKPAPRPLAPAPRRVLSRQAPSSATELRPAVVAPAPSAAPVPSAASIPIPAPPAAQGEALAVWRGALAAWLSAHRRYPEQARHDGVQGQPTVRFTVEPSGRVTSVELVTSSGSAVLDEATIAMLRGAMLPPFPPGLPRAARTESVRVHYSLEQ